MKFGFFFLDKTWKLMDYGSSNGVKMNKVRLKDRIIIFKNFQIPTVWGLILFFCQKVIH